MRHEQIKLYIQCDHCGMKEWGIEKDNFETLQAALMMRGWLFAGDREHCSLCRSKIETTNLIDGDEEIIQDFFYSSFPGSATDQDVLNGWYRVVDQILGRHAPCRHDLNTKAVSDRLDRINKAANEKCRHGVMFAENCEQCEGV